MHLKYIYCSNAQPCRRLLARYLLFRSFSICFSRLLPITFVRMNHLISFDFIRVSSWALKKNNNNNFGKRSVNKQQANTHPAYLINSPAIIYASSKCFVIFFIFFFFTFYFLTLSTPNEKVNTPKRRWQPYA